MTGFIDMAPQERAQQIVVALVGDQQADVWWHTPNRAFGGRAPVIQWDDDQRKVLQYLFSQLSGDYS